MSIVLSHISALEFWRSAASDAGPPRAACALRDAPACAPPPASSSERALLSCGTFSAPLHVLALDGRRKSTPHFVVHQARSLPSGSFRAIALEGAAEPLFVACPELAFAHLAASLSFARAVHLGYELCGTYAPDDSRPFGVRNRSPLATPDSIAAYLDQAGAVRGAGPARVALPHVLALSASPRESTLSMLLTLPYARGGSNIAHPRMNAVIPLGKRNRWAADRSHFRCDLLWPEQNVAVEYDSTLCHTGPTRIAADAARRNALESLGLTVMTATWRQVANRQEYERFARILAGHLGARIRPSCQDYARKQFALRAELLR